MLIQAICLWLKRHSVVSFVGRPNQARYCMYVILRTKIYSLCEMSMCPNKISSI